MDYSRWMSNLLAVIIPDVEYADWMAKPKRGTDYINGTIVLKVRLAVQKEDGEWHEYSRKDNLRRTLSCKIPDEKRVNGYKYDCDMIQMFELQSLYYDYYLINLQFLGGLG